MDSMLRVRLAYFFAGAEAAAAGGGYFPLHGLQARPRPSSVLGLATAIWVFFEWLDYHFLTIISFILVLGMVIQFVWSSFSRNLGHEGVQEAAPSCLTTDERTDVLSAQNIQRLGGGCALMDKSPWCWPWRSCASRRSDGGRKKRKRGRAPREPSDGELSGGGLRAAGGEDYGRTEMEKKRT
ncbi:hypothetical protein ACQ4PT_003967 [Festuca glaucescens]